MTAESSVLPKLLNSTSNQHKLTVLFTGHLSVWLKKHVNFLTAQCNVPWGLIQGHEGLTSLSSWGRPKRLATLCPWLAGFWDTGGLGTRGSEWESGRVMASLQDGRTSFPDQSDSWSSLLHTRLVSTTLPPCWPSPKPTHCPIPRSEVLEEGEETRGARLVSPRLEPLRLRWGSRASGLQSPSFSLSGAFEAAGPGRQAEGLGLGGCPAILCGWGALSRSPGGKTDSFLDEGGLGKNFDAADGCTGFWHIPARSWSWHPALCLGETAALRLIMTQITIQTPLKDVLSQKINR